MTSYHKIYTTKWGTKKQDAVTVRFKSIFYEFHILAWNWAKKFLVLIDVEILNTIFIYARTNNDAILDLIFLYFFIDYKL